jgi:hypothetical protein
MEYVELWRMQGKRAPDTETFVNEVRERHQPNDEGLCESCGQNYRCDAIVLSELIETGNQEIARLQKQRRQLEKLVEEVAELVGDYHDCDR